MMVRAFSRVVISVMALFACDRDRLAAESGPHGVPGEAK
jgi:hypothetical protein